MKKTENIESDFRQTMILIQRISDDRIYNKNISTLILKKLKIEITQKIVHLRKNREASNPIVHDVEKYNERNDKNETPLQFFLRVYKPFRSAGIVPAHIRQRDKRYYYNLHMWCQRNGNSVIDLCSSGLEKLEM